MPERFSSPERPAFCVATASDMSDTPPPATTSGGSIRVARKSPASVKTTPGKPASGTRRFEPFPSARTGSPSAAARVEERGERVRVVDLHEEPRRPADPERRPPGERDVLAHDRAQAAQRPSAIIASGGSAVPTNAAGDRAGEDVVRHDSPAAAAGARARRSGPASTTSSDAKEEERERTAPIRSERGSGRHERVDRKKRDRLPRDLVHDDLRRIADAAQARRLAGGVDADHGDPEREAARGPRRPRQNATRCATGIAARLPHVPGADRQEARPEPRRDERRHARRRENLAPGAKIAVALDFRSIADLPCTRSFRTATPS